MYGKPGMTKLVTVLLSVMIPHIAIAADGGDSVTLPLRTRDDQGKVQIDTVQVKGSELAIIVMDMWDNHWDPNWVSHAGARAEPMNRFLHRARAKGAVVIHSPTNLISGYGGPVYQHTKQRVAAAKTPKSTAPRDNGFMPKPTDPVPWGKNRVVSGKAHGMDGKPASAPNLLSNQCIGIDIEADDYITGEWGTLQEAWNIAQKHETKYILYVGGATNMCLIAKPIGLRHMKARGIETILVRDLAIAWSDPFHWHRRNEKLPEDWSYRPLKADAFVADWVEREMSPAVTSEIVSGPTPHTLKLTNASATYSQQNAEVAKAIDGSTTRRNGWGLGTHVGVETTAVFELAEETGNRCSERLDFVLQFASHDKTCLLGKFRISVTTDDRDSFANGKSNHGDVEANWTVLNPVSGRTLSTATSLQIGKDGIVVCKTEMTPDYDCFYISADNPLGDEVTGFRLEALPDESLPNRGPGLSANGNFVLGEINVRTWRDEPPASPWKIPDDKENFHVFLLMGQSNMTGGGVVESDDRNPVPGVVFIPPRELDWEPAAHPLHRPGRGFGLGLSFARTYQKNHPGVTVGLIPLARGGAQINKLHKGTDVYAEALKKAAIAKQSGAVKGVLWHQGESDTVHEFLAVGYEETLHALINDLRTDLKDSSLPFVVGNLAPEYGTGVAHNAPAYLERIKKVRKVLRGLPGKMANAGFAESTGGTTSDKVHFDRKSYIMLGENYAAAYEIARNDRLATKKTTSAEPSGRRGFDSEVALTKLHVAEGLKIELFAAEPLVRQPVTMTVDDRDRVWVIQYLQYPEPAGLKKVAGDRYDRITYDRLPKPPPHGPRGADRITILEDTDGDGRADKADDFIDGLNMASGLALGHGGVWVLQSPYLLFYPDRNKDDRSDGEPEVRLVGFGLDDAHSVANSLQWGPDGWLYGVHGSTVNANVRGVKFQQGVWRYHPSTDRFELFSEGGGNTYGLDFDNLGNAIAGTNFGVPGLHQMQGAYHVKNFGKHGALRNPHAFGYFQHMPHAGTSVGKLSVGGIFYQSEQWPARFRNKFVTANPLNHALYAIDVRPRGSTFTTQFQERLLWSDDAWFQPVDMAIEADGSMLVADWYDGNINYQRTYRDRNNFDSKRGRIYRVSAIEEQSKPDTSKSTDDVFETSVLRARRSLQSLAEQRDKSLAPKYAKLLDEADDERQALHALWGLNLCQSLHESDDLAVRYLQHRYSAVRAWTVRLLGDESHVTPPVREQLVKMARDEVDVRVRAQLACTAKRLPGDDCLAIAVELARHDEDQTDPYLPLLLWWAVESKTVTDRDQVLSWLENSGDWQRPLLRDTIIPRLARRYASEGGESGFATCAQLLALAPTSADVDRVIGGMEEQLQGLKQGKMPEALRAPLAKLWEGENLPQSLILFTLRMSSDAALREAVARMSDKTIPEGDRIALIDAAGQTGNNAVLKPLLDLFLQTESNSVRSATLASAARFDDPATGKVILEKYRSLGHDLRGEARQILYSRAPWAQQLLQAIERGELNPAEIPYQELPLLQTHTDPSIRKLVHKHWGKVRLVTPQEKRDRMMELGRMLLSETGDVTRGKMQFMNVCGKCHRLHGDGEKVGPDLTPYPRHELSYLLLHSVDPSAVIRPAYQAVTVVTNDGRVLSGLLAESTPKTVTLLDAKNKRILLAKDDIELVKESEQSLMPEKVFSTLKPEQIRDLFAYLQSKTTEPLRNDLSSLSGLQETFDAPSDVWTIADNGDQTTPRFQTAGGRPGGWLQLDDASGGRMAIVLPKSWHGKLNRNEGSVLSFDARTVDAKNGRPHEAFGVIEITGAGRTILADAATVKPIVPGDSWATYHLPFDAKTFRVSETDWKRILGDVSKVIIRLEGYAGANEVMGVDNVSLKLP
jgi:putative membrane-bound dehydrogenase-like protein